MEIFDVLTGTDTKQGHQLMLDLEAQSFGSDVLYCLFDEFVALISHSSSFVRTRGFRLAVAQVE